MSYKIKIFLACQNWREYKRRVANSLVFGFLLLALLLPSAFGTKYYESAGYWTNAQCTEEQTGQSSAIMTWVNQTAISSGIYGSNYPALTGDLDGDGVTEAFIGSGSYLLAYTTPGNSLVVKSQVTLLGGTAAFSGAIIEDRDNFFKLIAQPSGTNLNFYRMNSSGSLLLYRSVNMTAQNVSFATGLVCTSTTSAGYGDLCAWGTDNGRIAEYVFKTNYTDSLHVGGDVHFNGTPAFSTNFNGAKLAFIANNNTGTFWQVDVYVVAPISLNTGFTKFASAVGSVTNSVYPGSVAFYNMDSSGYDELFVSGVQYLTNSVTVMTALDSSGTHVKTYSGYPHLGYQYNYGAPLIFGYFTTKVKRQVGVCDSFNTGAGDVSNDCWLYNYTDDSTTYTGAYYLDNANYAPRNIPTLDTNNDGYRDIVTFKGVYSPHLNKWYAFSTSAGGFLSVGDTNGDGNGEIISSISGASFVVATETSMTFNPYLITLNGRGLDIIPDVVACEDTSVTFYGFDCFNHPGHCNYVNAVNGTSEFLYTTCGHLGHFAYHTGLAVEDSPSVSCLYNVSGSYAFDVYVAVNGHATYTNADPHFEQTIQVLPHNASVPGVNCNAAPVTGGTGGGTSTTTTPGVTTTTGNTDIDTYMDIITQGGNTVIKNLLALVVTIAIIFGLIKLGVQNPVIYGIGIFAIWILLGMLGIISWIFVILFAFVAIGAAALIFVVSNNNT